MDGSEGGCEMIHTIFLLSLTQSSLLQLSRSVLHLHRLMILIVAQAVPENVHTISRRTHD